MGIFDAQSALTEVQRLTKGHAAFLGGSLVAADLNGKPFAWSDVDLFCPTFPTLVALGQHLLSQGCTFDEKFDRVWARWLKFGIKGWHTNSIRFNTPDDLEINLVYKITDGHPTTSLAQVIESFDFGLLHSGYDTETWTFRDMRSYLFPGSNKSDALPLMPNKRWAWRNGYISEYNGIREFSRYAKYHEYGYDMSEVKDDLVTGYREGSLYLSNHFDEAKQERGRMYTVIADHIEADNIDQLLEAAKEIDYKNPLDSIMEALE